MGTVLQKWKTSGDHQAAFRDVRMSHRVWRKLRGGMWVLGSWEGSIFALFHVTDVRPTQDGMGRGVIQEPGPRRVVSVSENTKKSSSHTYTHNLRYMGEMERANV